MQHKLIRCGLSRHIQAPPTSRHTIDNDALPSKHSAHSPAASSGLSSSQKPVGFPGSGWWWLAGTYQRLVDFPPGGWLTREPERWGCESSIWAPDTPHIISYHYDHHQHHQIVWGFITRATVSNSRTFQAPT